MAHRLALARVRAHLGPVDRQRPEPHNPHLARHPHHLHEQPPELLQMAAAKLTQRAVLGKVPRRKQPKRHILLELPRDRA